MITKICLDVLENVNYYKVNSCKVERADLTCDVIRNSVCVKQALNTCRWLVNVLVTWHVSYKITTLLLDEVEKNKFNDGQHLILPALEIEITLKNEDLDSEYLTLKDNLKLNSWPHTYIRCCICIAY